MSVLLKMEKISKFFPGVRALTDVDFEMRPGEVHALIGENGAGKSTLMKCLTGVYQPDGGTVTFDGEPWSVSNPKEATDRGISIVHQEFNLMPALTVRENIFISREPRKFGGMLIDDKEMREKCLELMKRVDFYIDPDAEVQYLSVAHCQMVEILRALLTDVKILVLDEPTSSLTSEETEILFRTIRTLRDRGVGIVYISHRLDEFEHIVDRVTILRDGQFVATKPYNEITLNEMIALMVGREMTEQYPERNATIGEVALEARNFVSPKLKDVSLYVRKGEVLGLAGLIGAGRTEFARAIFGADPINSGELYLHGELVHFKQPSDAVEHGVAYLSEDRKRDGLMLNQGVDFNTYIANLGEYSKFGLIDDKKINDTVESFINALTIRTPTINQWTQFLSGGNQQKVLVSRWLCKKSDVIIFDEPTRGIDVGSKYEIYKLINDLAEQGVAIIMISSEMPEVMGMSDRIMVMYEGTVTGEISTEEANQEIIMHMASNTYDRFIKDQEQQEG
ncbi:MAG: sugar ABC transporter ATP-binding protein [Christensenellaceae bacterium]|jgi:ribose transport system ATP-binding protein